MIEPHRKIGIDLDGVLRNFNRAFVQIVNELWGGRLPADFVQQDWDWASAGLTGEDINKVWSALKNTRNFWLLCDPYDENITAVRCYTQRHPHDELFYVTSMVETEGAPAHLQAEMWLKHYGVFPAGAKVIVTSHASKFEVYTTLGVTVSVDDYWENQKSSAAHLGFLLERPWNQGHRDGHLLVKSLEDFLTIVENIPVEMLRKQKS